MSEPTPIPTPVNPSSSLASMRELIALGLLLACATATPLIRYSFYGDIFAAFDDRLYQAGVLAFNYFEFGPIRRGLAGSVVYLLGHDILKASTRFFLLSAVAVALPVMWLYRSLPLPRTARYAFAATIVAIMLRWAGDIGRTDMLVAAGIAAAAIATTRGRLGLAALMLGMGLMIHETSVIFGAPLLVVILMRPGAWSAVSAASKWRGAAVLLLSLAVYAGMTHLPHASDTMMSEVVRAKFAPTKYVDWAVYFALSGLRGLRTNLCQNGQDPTYWMHPAGGLLLVALTTMALGWNLRREGALTAVATIPPLVFLSIFTNDISRWAMFAMFNVWLLHAVAHRREGRRTISEREALLAAVALLVLTSNKLGTAPTPIYSPSPVLERIAVRLFRTGPTPNVEDALKSCDPTWHDFVLAPDRTSREPR
jgi:hypothetical protein